MARDLPAVLPGGNGRKPTGRDALGRFVSGASPGPGRPANPFGRYQAQLRAGLMAAVTPADLQAVIRQVLRLARRGSLPAAELVLKWTLGAPLAAVNPDRVDEDELSVRRGRPTLIDEMTLTDEQADRTPAEDDPAAAEDDAGDADLDDAARPLDPLQPTLAAIVAWALRQWAEAQTHGTRPAPDPQAGWERFAASHVDFDPQAAAPLDLVLLAYLRWCASHGETPLAEEHVLGWLTAHGATLRTGAVSQHTALAGVRVVA